MLKLDKKRSRQADIEKMMTKLGKNSGSKKRWRIKLAVVRGFMERRNRSGNVPKRPEISQKKKNLVMSIWLYTHDKTFFEEPSSNGRNLIQRTAVDFCLQSKVDRFYRMWFLVWSLRVFPFPLFPLFISVTLLPSRLTRISTAGTGPDPSPTLSRRRFSNEHR